MSAVSSVSPHHHHLSSLHTSKMFEPEEQQKSYITRAKQNNQEQKKEGPSTDHISTYKLNNDISRASTSNSGKRLRDDKRAQGATHRQVENDNKHTPEGTLVVQEGMFLPPIK